MTGRSMTVMAAALSVPRYDHCGELVPPPVLPPSPDPFSRLTALHGNLITANAGAPEQVAYRRPLSDHEPPTIDNILSPDHGEPNSSCHESGRGTRHLGYNTPCRFPGRRSRPGPRMGRRSLA